MKALKTEQDMKGTRGTIHINDIQADIQGEFQGLDPEQPLFSIGTAAAMLEVHPRTLRIYEEEGLVRPYRKAGRRYYSLNDIQWIKCLRYMIHDQGISIAGIKRLLEFTPCWNIAECPMEKRKKCSAYGCAITH